MLTGTGIPPAVCHGPCLQTPWMSFMNRHIPQCECHNAVEDLSLQPGLKEKAYFQEALRERGQASEECNQLKVIESHGDQVQYLNFLRPAELSVWLLTQDGVTTVQPWYLCQDHITTVMNSPLACEIRTSRTKHTGTCIFQVLELPKGAELLASSQTAPNEIWTYQDRVLAIQGHPEMASQEALQKIWPFLSSNGCVSAIRWSCNITKTG